MFGNAQAHRLFAAGLVDGGGDAFNTGGGGFGKHLDFTRLAFGFVDLLFFFGDGKVDDLGFLTFRNVDFFLPFAFRAGDHGAAFALGAHLLFQRVVDGVGQQDVGNLITQHFHAPGLRGFIQRVDDFDVDFRAFFKGFVQLNLADDRAQRGLRQTGGGVAIVGNAVAGRLRVDDLQIEHAIDADADVVAGDALLLRYVKGFFFQGVAVGDAVDEGHEDVKTGFQRARVFAQTLHDVGRTLRDDAHDVGQDDKNGDDEKNGNGGDGGHDGELLCDKKGDENSGVLLRGAVLFGGVGTNAQGQAAMTDDV